MASRYCRLASKYCRMAGVAPAESWETDDIEASVTFGSFMIVLALDTATPAGSTAVVRDGVVILERPGDARRTHGERLPRELMEALDAAGVSLDQIEAY